MTNRCVDTIVGLQYGSEGKGKVAALLARNYTAAVRVGAPNAGHTIWHNHNKYKMRSIPCAWINENCKLYIGAGGMINMDVLNTELHETIGIYTNRLAIDPSACIINHDDATKEADAGMLEKIGSTNEGVGLALANKIMRMRGDSVIASSVRGLKQFLRPVSVMLNKHVDMHENVMIEGTQGFGLSLDHGSYPYVTSRNVIAASMMSECGLSPLAARDIIGVMRTYPIRVAGNSGPMGAEELTWDDVRRFSGAPANTDLTERTTVTRRIRRVSHIDWDLLDRAVMMNRCTCIAITFLDYINYDDYAKSSWKDLSDKSREFVRMVESRLNVPVTIVSTGPLPEHTIYLSNED